MKNKLIYVQFLGKIDVFQTSKIQQTTEICYWRDILISARTATKILTRKPN